MADDMRSFCRLLIPMLRGLTGGGGRLLGPLTPPAVAVIATSTALRPERRVSSPAAAHRAR